MAHIPKQTLRKHKVDMNTPIGEVFKMLQETINVEVCVNFSIKVTGQKHAPITTPRLVISNYIHAYEDRSIELVIHADGEVKEYNLSSSY